MDVRARHRLSRTSTGVALAFPDDIWAQWAADLGGGEAPNIFHLSPAVVDEMDGREYPLLTSSYYVERRGWMAHFQLPGESEDDVECLIYAFMSKVTSWEIPARLYSQQSPLRPFAAQFGAEILRRLCWCCVDRIGICSGFEQLINGEARELWLCNECSLEQTYQLIHSAAAEQHFLIDNIAEIAQFRTIVDACDGALPPPHWYMLIDSPHNSDLDLDHCKNKWYAVSDLRWVPLRDCEGQAWLKFGSLDGLVVERERRAADLQHTVNDRTAILQHTLQEKYAVGGPHWSCILDENNITYRGWTNFFQDSLQELVSSSPGDGDFDQLAIKFCCQLFLWLYCRSDYDLVCAHYEDLFSSSIHIAKKDREVRAQEKARDFFLKGAAKECSPKQILPISDPNASHLLWPWQLETESERQAFADTYAEGLKKRLIRKNLWIDDDEEEDDLSMGHDAYESGADDQDYHSNYYYHQY
jgi:hypothetical protein